MFLSKKLRVYFFSFLFMTTPFVVSCGGNSSSDNSPSKEGSIGATPFLLISDSGLSLADSVLKGSGSAVAKNPLGEIKDEKNIAITFALEEGGSVSVKAFGSKTIDGAVTFTFTRKEKVLSAKFDAAGKSVDVSKNFVALDATSEVSLLIDVHNGETPAHVLAWKGDIEKPDDANALFNSEKAGDGESPGNGTGTFWGLTISKAVVKKASSGEAKFEHE